MQVKFLKSIVIPAIAGGIVFLSSCGDSGEKKAFSNFASGNTNAPFMHLLDYFIYK